MWIGVDMQTDDRRIRDALLQHLCGRSDRKSARTYGVAAFWCFANASLKRCWYSQLLCHTRGIEINTLRGGWDCTQCNW